MIPEIKIMTEQNAKTSHDDRQSNQIAKEASMVGGGHYEITIEGHIDKEWADWFGDLCVSYDGRGFSTLSGFIVDQSSLHGILAQIRDLALTLVSLTRLG